MEGLEKNVTKGIIIATVAYALCSSSMLLINKVAVHTVPAPGFVLICQLAAASVVAGLLGVRGVVEVDSLDPVKIKAFLPAALSFLGVIYTNIKVGGDSSNRLAEGNSQFLDLDGDSVRTMRTQEM